MKTEYEGWFDITTAPKDGTRIMLRFYVAESVHHIEIGRWHTSLRTLKAFWRLDRDDDSALTSVNVSMRPQPTHWSPIPYPKVVVGPVIHPLSDEPEVVPMSTPAQPHGIRFHYLDGGTDVVAAHTRKALTKWAASTYGGKPTDDENIQDAWTRIRTMNALGTIPWVFSDPYESDLNGRCELCVERTEMDAELVSSASADNL